MLYPLNILSQVYEYNLIRFMSNLKHRSMKKERQFTFYSIISLLRRTILVLSEDTAKYRALSRTSVRYTEFCWWDVS